MKSHERFKPLFTGQAIAVLLLCAAIPAAHAGSPKYKKGGKPVCSVSIVGGTGTASCTSGSVAGLGNADVRVSVSLTVSAPTLCAPPGNPGNTVPGQHRATATGSSSIGFSPDQIKNGALVLPPISTSVTLAVPSADAAGCPNSSWTVFLGTPSFGAGTYTFEQPIGTTVSSLTFSF
jgi:hypothetical protein